MSDTLAAVEALVCRALTNLEVLFKPAEYEMTFIARHKTNPLAHVIVSSEQPEERFPRTRQTLDDLEATGKEVRHGEFVNEPSTEQKS